MGFPVVSVGPFRPRLSHVAAALFFLVVSVVTYARYLNVLPDGVHAWAQADRLALAINFYDFGFDFFKPRTSNLGSIGGVTGVEFPLQAYLAALGGAVLGRAHIGFLFRLLDVAMTMTGFYYLFRVVYERTGHFVAGLVPGAFLLASPAFSFYAGSTLPDPFSLSFSFVGYYYWLRFFDHRRFPDLLVALVVLGVAALVKTTTAMHFGAVVGITLLWDYFHPELLDARQRRVFVAVAAAVLGVLAAFFWRTQYLNATYQSLLFLAEARPIADPQTRHDVLRNVHGMWVSEYASVAQYCTLGACAGLLLVFARRNRRHHLPLTLLALAATALGYVFVQLMGAQFRDHDYYVICPVFAPALLVLVLALLNIGHYSGRLRYLSSVGLAVLMCVFLVNGNKRLRERMSDNDPPFSPYGHLWMRGGAAELARLNVPAKAKVLVFNEPAPNLGLVYFDRRGQVWQPSDVATVTPEALVSRMAADNLDYLIMSPAAYAQLASQHAALAPEFDLVGQAPGVVLRRRNTARPW